MSDLDEESEKLAKNRNYDLNGLYLIPLDARAGTFSLSSAMPSRGYEFFILVRQENL